MSLYDLKSLVSVEDFADAHEPLNDGVKAVPNAKTVAASVGTGDVGKDTTSQGPAKVVPEKPDTDDKTKTEHNVVKESAEKSGGSDSKPTSPKAPEADKPAGDKAPPFPPKEKEEESADEGEKLEHNSEKSAKDELEKTEGAKAALEAYAKDAKRFDIIGHPTRRSAEIGKVMGYIQRRSGQSGAITISAESIDQSIALSHTRIAKLEREVRILGSRTVSNEEAAPAVQPAGKGATTTTTTTTTTSGQENLVEEIAVTEAPTEHGAPPMDPVAAAALTEAELDPLDVPMLEIQKVQETLDVLETGQAAIEQYRLIIRETPRMSKQAAAVLHAGLEHIDKMCSLKVRTTGMEAYLTTPRAAMEEADPVDEKTLGSRAAEIGARILKWIKVLLKKLTEYWQKLQPVIASTRDKATALQNQVKALSDEPKQSEIQFDTNSSMWLASDFVGLEMAPIIVTLPKELAAYYTALDNRIAKGISKSLTADFEASKDRIIMVIENTSRNLSPAFTTQILPGGKRIEQDGVGLSLVDVSEPTAKPVGLDMDKATMLRGIGLAIKVLETLENSRALDTIKASQEHVSKAVVDFRKGDGAKWDEADFQAIQTSIVNQMGKAFNAENYFGIVKYIAQQAANTVKVISVMAKAW